MEISIEVYVNSAAVVQLELKSKTISRGHLISNDRKNVVQEKFNTERSNVLVDGMALLEQSVVSFRSSRSGIDNKTHLIRCHQIDIYVPAFPRHLNWWYL